MSRQPLNLKTASIRGLIEEIEAAPAAEFHQPPGFSEPTRISPVTPAVVGTISLSGEQIPAATAAEQLGIYYPPLPAGSVGATLRLSEAIAKQSRFCRAGGNLVLANKAPKPTQANGDPNFYNRPQQLRLVKPVEFAPLADGAEVAASAYPVTGLEVKIGDAANYSVRFTVSRRQQKDLPPDLVNLEIALSVARGLANLVDRVVLQAILAATPGAFNLGHLAARDVLIDEIRGIVGTDGTGATWRGDGVFSVAGGIPAELTPVVAGTVAGAFGRAFAVISDNTYLVLKRNDPLGSIEVLCHVNIKPAILDAGYFGTVAA